MKVCDRFSGEGKIGGLTVKPGGCSRKQLLHLCSLEAHAYKAPDMADNSHVQRPTGERDLNKCRA